MNGKCCSVLFWFDKEVTVCRSPTVESANQISADFENDKKSKYAGVHIYFLDLVSHGLYSLIPSSFVMSSHDLLIFCSICSLLSFGWRDELWFDFFLFACHVGTRLAMTW